MIKEQHRLLKTRAALSGKSLTQLFLEAIGVIPEQEFWLSDPANKKLVAEIKQALKETGTIDLGLFKEYAEG